MKQMAYSLFLSTLLALFVVGCEQPTKETKEKTTTEFRDTHPEQKPSGETKKSTTTTTTTTNK